VILVGYLALLGCIRLWAESQWRAAEEAWREDRVEDARRCVQRSLAIWPWNAAAHLLAARVERLSGAYRKAEHHLKELKELQGMTAEIQLEWVLLRAQGGELDSLEANLHHCLAENHPQSSVILEALARCYIRELRHRSAHHCLRQWLAREPDNLRALYWRGWVREKLDFKEGAFQDYRSILERIPGRWQIRLRLAQMYLEDARVREAGEDLKLLEDMSPRPRALALALGQLRFMQGRMQEARDLFDEYLAQDATHAGALTYRAKLADCPIEAESWFRRALKADPAFLDARFGLFTSLNQQSNREKEAAMEWQRCQDYQAKFRRLRSLLADLERSPSADLLAEAGEIMLKNGNESLGRQFLVKALRSHGGDPGSHRILARYFEKRP
jgi:tetratricopeptide (TPR) repeat protein